MVKYTCDHCGKEINDDGDFIEYDIEFEGNIYPCDLCAECKKEIYESVDKHIGEFIGGTGEK